MKEIIEIEVTNIEVDDGYYSFDYSVTRNGKKRKDRYDGDFDSQTPAQWKKILEKGEAVNLILETL